jgi:hypothetical protein
MKKVYYSLLLLFIATTTFAQGIAVQGIARDNANSAITDTNLTFTFTISKNDNVALYTETQPIKTDNFGVFSHIVSGGTPVTGTFNAVDFSITNLKIKISVNYLGNTLEVYNQTFQYTPYAHFAKKAAFATNATNAVNAENAGNAVNAYNGVPTGSILPYLGATAPAGWLLCNGATIPSSYTALRALLGRTTTPNLGGLYLKGAGSNGIYGTNTDAVGLGLAQVQAIAAHSSVGVTENGGVHSHTVPIGLHSRSFQGENGSDKPYQIEGTPTTLQSNSAGNHNHNVTVTYNGGKETRPNSFGVNYIIKI